MQTPTLPGIFFALSLPAAAQLSAPETTAAALQTWQAQHGPRWTVQLDPSTGRAGLLYGGRAEFGPAPRLDEQWIAHAATALRETEALHGVAPATLSEPRVTLLPLGMVGSGDKWAVEFRQAVGGLPVQAGAVVLLFDARGALIALHSTALPELTELALDPRVDAAQALELATLDFAKRTGLATTRSETPRLVIRQHLQDERRVARLAWQVDLAAEGGDHEPQGFTYWIDARAGVPLARETNIHFFDVFGKVHTFATPGLPADHAGNPETAQAVKYMTVQYSGGSVTTDVNGTFVLPGVNAPQTVTLGYSGPWSVVDDVPSGVGHSETLTLTQASGNVVVLNAGAVDSVTAQANVFNHTATLRDYVRRIVPGDATADRVFTGHCNIAATCNAYYNGGSVNFYAAGGSCNNTGFSTVIGHELGHWLNNLYGTGNGGDGMGEGAADVWTMYAFDTPINGDHFFTSGGFVRSGNNTRQFCGDCSPGCHGGVHADGQVLGGALWKVRDQLNTALGNSMGDLVADLLWMGWMNGFNQSTIRSVIELQWLLLDDDDANLLNGTPHKTQIVNGFRAQGFPGYYLEIPSVTALVDQTCEAGSYPVQATIQAVNDSTVAGGTLSWRVGGGAWVAVPMNSLGGNTWAANIPYVASPAVVQYTVTALDSAGHTREAFCSPREFLVAQVQSVFAESFEADTGWTHGVVGTPNNANDDWQRGAPLGRSGVSGGVNWTDPALAAAGLGAIGNDLGINSPAAGNGAYQNDVHSYLRSPVYDCSGQSGLRLIYKRWLTVEEAQFDVARILVNGSEVWRNATSGHHVDLGWVTHDVDISAVADGNPAVTVEFQLQTDGGLTLGGWQIDSLSIGRLVAAPRCNAVQAYCFGDGSLATGCPCGNRGASGRGCAHSSSAQGALLGSSGVPVANTLRLEGSGMPSTALGLYMQHDALGETVFHDGVLCAGGTLVRLRSRASVAGASTFPDSTDTMTLAQRGGVVPGSAARRYYAVWYRNATTTFCPPATANVTNGLQVVW